MQMSWGRDAECISFVDEDEIATTTTEATTMQVERKMKWKWTDEEDESSYSFTNYKNLQSQTEWKLPVRGQRLSKLEEKCLSDGLVINY